MSTDTQDQFADMERILRDTRSDHEVVTVRTVAHDVNSYRVVEVTPELQGRTGTPRTFILPESEAIPSKQHADGFKVVLLDQHSTVPMVSQTDPALVTSLLDAVSPEVRNGTVAVKGIVRMPGVRTKLAVASTDAEQDPIAAILGRSSNRAVLLSQLLGGERVDVVAWHPNRFTFLRNALNPAPTSWLIARDRKVLVGVPGHLISAAVGEGGLNSSLSGRVSGLSITIVKAETPAEELLDAAVTFLTSTPEETLKALQTVQAGKQDLVTVSRDKSVPVATAPAPKKPKPAPAKAKDTAETSAEEEATETAPEVVETPEAEEDITVSPQVIQTVSYEDLDDDDDQTDAFF